MLNSSKGLFQFFFFHHFHEVKRKTITTSVKVFDESKSEAERRSYKKGYRTHTYNGYSNTHSPESIILFRKFSRDNKQMHVRVKGILFIENYPMKSGLSGKNSSFPLFLSLHISFRSHSETVNSEHAVLYIYIIYGISASWKMIFYHQVVTETEFPIYFSSVDSIILVSVVYPFRNAIKR